MMKKLIANMLGCLRSVLLIVLTLPAHAALPADPVFDLEAIINDPVDAVTLEKAVDDKESSAGLPVGLCCPPYFSSSPVSNTKA
jgi:hypothetical protein